LSYDRNALNIANLSPFFELEPMAGKEPLGNPRFSHTFLHGETTVSPTPFEFNPV